MRRRDFIKLIAGSAASWPLTAGAQQAGKLPTIGFLGAAKRSAYSQWDAAFVQRLRELGWAEGRSERYAEIANEFVQLKVNVIVTWGTVAVVAAKRATMEIPIVFAATGDPVGTGLVAKLARPGGNVTGLSNQLPDGAGKRIGLFREIVPDLRRLAIMTNIGSPIGALEMSEAQAAAHKLGLEVLPLEIRRAEDIAPAFEALRGDAQALYVVSEPLAGTNMVRINTLALGLRLPTVHGLREYAEAGGLMSYGPNIPDLFR